MYYKNPISSISPQYRKCRTYKSRKISPIQRRILSGFRSLTHVFFILIMSLVIVKASAIAIYQNRTATETLTTGSHQNNLSRFQATTSEFITTVPQITLPVLDYLQPQHRVNTTVTNHIIRTNIIVGGSQDLEEPQENMRAKLQQLLQREKDDDEEKRQLQLDQQQHLIVQEQQQQQYQNQQPEQYQQLQQQPQHAILAGENAYLLERIDGGVHEQPIYGTWSAKARRPQAPPKPTASAAVAASSTPSLQTLIGEVDEHHDYENHQPHHYERLPRRSSTMTPLRRELHDQIPRPPRLTSRQPSLALRRQFTDTPQPSGSVRDEPRPKPFHFPFDGPLPEEFKKRHQSERGSVVGHDEVNNIQDILQKLHLSGMASTKMPSLMMMPTGLHISGSYKNLKSSGIANFFRGKRHKKQMQLQFPLPMQMFNAYQTPIMNLMPQGYQQRIAMDQIYPFKPRSPNDINLLAMQQQQQQQQHLKAHQSKNKKQKKKLKDKKNPLANTHGILMQQYPFASATAEPLYPSMFPPFMAVNLTQAPPHLTKRVPFKVNLDIFPVLPPSKNNKPMPYLAMDEARIVSSMRPPTMLRNPFVEYFSTPATPTASALGYYNQFLQKPSVYNPIKFPGAAQAPIIPLAQANNMQLTYSDQLQKYLEQQQRQQQQQQQQHQQQQQQQQQQHLYANVLNGQGHQTPFLPIDCDQPLPSGSGSSLPNSNTSPIMLHLNVFPKHKTSGNSPISTNPFYSNVPNNSNNLHRTIIQEENEAPLPPIEPRHQARALNDSSVSQIARSDNANDQQRDLVDFEHPIVAANDISELPTPAALVGSKPTDSNDSSFSLYDNRPNFVEALKAANNNYQMNTSGNLEQMVSEAKTASLFRFPVEDLIQFQVHDAM